MTRACSVLVHCLVSVAVLCVGASAAAQTWRQTQVANRFQVFVPPNNDTGTRFSVIVVTAMAGTTSQPCVVDLVDVNDDGDADDTVLGVALVEGQSLVRYIRDGAVNDDMSGIRDGDYFRVDASLPVAVLQATDSDWQHDWAPSTNGSMRGTRFVLFANGYSVSPRDIDVFAYEPGTRVELYDITATPLVDGSNRAISGITSLRPRPNAPVLSVDLDEGEDLVHVHGLGRDLLAVGRTYELVASKPVTVLFGAIASLVEGQNQAIDGAGYVPGRSGETADTDFYFQIPHNTNNPGQQELRVVSFDPENEILLRTWNPALRRYEPARSWALGAMGHADYVGGTARLYRLTSTGRVAVFEASWFETGSPGTSDDAAFVPALFTSSAGAQELLPYLGPPGRQTNTTIGGTYTHLYLYARTAVNGVTIVDADTEGTLFSRVVDVPALGYVDVRIDEAQYAALNRPSANVRPYLRVRSPAPIAVEMANWNDNWMAYATATVVRNPEVTLSLPTSIALGEPSPASGEVTNFGSTPLTDVVVRVDLPSGVTYVNGDFGGAPETAITTMASGTEVVFERGSIAPGESVPLTLEVVASSGSGTSGELLSIGASAVAAEGSGASVASVGSGTTQIMDPSVATMSELTATSGDRVVSLRVVANGPGSTLELSRSTTLAGPYVVLTSVSHPGEESVLAYTDTAVVNGTTYYYRARAVGLTGAESIAGPVVGQPVDRTPPPAPTLAARGGDGHVQLSVGGSSVADLVGYRLERRVLGATAWTSLTAAPIPGPTFVDSGLVNGTTYEYRARAVDDDANLSLYGPTVRGTPAFLPSRTTDRVVYFEDLIGPGVNDWDYNDFVVRVVAHESLEGDGVRRIVLDYEPIARGAGYVHQLVQHVPTAGAWTATITRTLPSGPEVEVVRGVGPARLVIAEDTRDVLPAWDRAYANSTLGQGRFRTGGVVQITLELDPTQNRALGSAPWDPYLVLPYIEGPNEVHLGAYGGVTETADRSDLAGWPLDFAFVADPVRAFWPPEGQPVWRAFAGFSPWVRQGTHARWFDEPLDPQTIWSRER